MKSLLRIIGTVIAIVIISALLLIGLFFFAFTGKHYGLEEIGVVFMIIWYFGLIFLPFLFIISLVVFLIYIIKKTTDSNINKIQKTKYMGIIIGLLLLITFLITLVSYVNCYDGPLKPSFSECFKNQVNYLISIINV